MGLCAVEDPRRYFKDLNGLFTDSVCQVLIDCALRLYCVFGIDCALRFDCLFGIDCVLRFDCLLRIDCLVLTDCTGFLF